MGWGFRSSAPNGHPPPPLPTKPAKPRKRSELEKRAGEVQAIFLAMPEAHQVQVAETVRAMLRTTVGLQVLPDELAEAIGRLVLRLFSELHMPFKHKPSAEQDRRPDCRWGPGLAGAAPDEPGRPTRGGEVMGGPGSGRKPKAKVKLKSQPEPRSLDWQKEVLARNGHHLAGPTVGPRVTFGQMFATVPVAAPAAPPDAHPIHPPGASVGPAPPQPAPLAPVERPGTRSFANLVGYVSANVGVAVIGDHLKRKGFEPHEPPPEDVDRAASATADAVVVAIGDAEVPWWGAVVASWGNLYLAMRVGAKRAEPSEVMAPAAETARPSPSLPASPLAAPAPPKVPPAPRVERGAPLPEIPIMGVS